MPPSINKSDALFTVEDIDGRSYIRVGLSAIKQVGGAARAVVTSRLRRKRDFVNLFDLAVSVDLRVMNRKALECLILSGAFDELDNHRARLIANVDKAIKFGQMQNRSVTLGQCGFFSAEEGAQLEDKHYPDMDQAEIMPEAEKLLHEKKLVGFYLSHHARLTSLVPVIVRVRVALPESPILPVLLNMSAPVPELLMMPPDAVVVI